MATLLPGAALGIFAGYLLAARLADGAVVLAVGLISIAFAIRNLAARGGQDLPPTRSNFPLGTFWGALSGFTSMIAHAGGPPYQIYTMPLRLPPAVFVGTGALFFALINIIKVVPYLALGQFTTQNLTASLALLPVAILSTIAGVWLVRRVPVKRFYGIIYTLLLLVGLKLTYDGLMGLRWLP